MEFGTTPAVSVVMPVYNGEQSLAAAVDSILAQTFRQFELIVVDDGCTDGSPGILASYQARDSRVVVLTHPRNQGLRDALNTGMAHARGRYVARQDADDVSRLDRLGTQVRVLDQDQGTGLLGSAFTEIDASGTRLSTQRLPGSDTEIRWRLLFDSPFAHGCVMFRREFLPVGTPAYTSFYCEDYDLWARLLLRTRGRNLDEPLVKRRTHGDSYTTTHSQQQAARRAEIAMREIDRLAPGLGLSKEDVDRLYAWYNAFPVVLGEEEFRLCDALLAMLAAFRRQPGVDARTARRLVGDWGGRILRGLPDYRYRRACRDGLVGRLFRSAPSQALADLARRSLTRFRAKGGTGGGASARR